MTLCFLPKIRSLEAPEEEIFLFPRSLLAFTRGKKQGVDGILSGTSAHGSNRAGHRRGYRHRKAVDVGQPMLTVESSTHQKVIGIGWDAWPRGLRHDGEATTLG
jgi:hypothetical protein